MLVPDVLYPVVASIDGTHFFKGAGLISWSRDDGFTRYNVSGEARDFHVVDDTLYFLDTSMDGDHDGDLFSVTPGVAEPNQPTDIGCVRDIDVFNGALIVAGYELRDAFIHTNPQLSYLGDDGLLHEVVDTIPITVLVDGDICYGQDVNGANIFTVDASWNVDWL